MRISRRLAGAIGTLAILVVACDLSYMLPSSPGFPTARPGVMEAIVAGTAGAAQTQTAALIGPSSTATWTPTVTRTPTLTPTLTPTFIFRLRSPVPARTATETPGSTSGQLGCRLLSQDPADGTKMSPRRDFDVVWEVRNTGSASWDKASVDFAFFNGDKLHTQAVYDLSKNVNSGASINLVVDMVAPRDEGRYRTVWALRRGKEDFCRVSLTITVR